MAYWITCIIAFLKKNMGRLDAVSRNNDGLAECCRLVEDLTAEVRAATRRLRERNNRRLLTKKEALI